MIHFDDDSLSRSSKIIDYDTTQQPVCNFTLVVNSDTGSVPIWHHSGCTVT